jgi:hypothetical protein
MTTEYDENLKKFMKEAETIANYLHQQVRQGSIHQSLYVENIRRFISAYEDLKSCM